MKRVDQVDPALRAAKTSDLEAVHSLLRAAQLPVEGLADQFGDQYVVAESETGPIIGAAGVELYNAAGLLRSVVVLDEHRGTGLGERLTRDRIAWCRGRGLQEIYLLTTTAAPFFARHGFETVPRSSAPASLQASREFAAICPSTAVCMRLGLRK